MGETMGETLRWRGEHAGRRAGEVIHLDGREWLVVVSARRALTRRLTEADEDRGRGQEGDVVTTQDVTVRPATPEEVAAEEARRASAEAARRAATVDGQLEAWLAETGAVAVSAERGSEIAREIARAGVAWTTRAQRLTESGGLVQSLAVGVLDGAPVARVDTYDMPERYYERVAPGEQARRAEAERLAGRARAFAAAQQHGVAAVLTWSRACGTDYGVVAEPATDAERAAVEAGRAVDADRARLLVLLVDADARGVVEPAAATEVVAILTRLPREEARAAWTWRQIAAGLDDIRGSWPRIPSRLHLLGAIERAASTGQRVAWAPAHALAQVGRPQYSTPRAEWAPIARLLEARGLGWATRPPELNTPDRLAECLDALDAWCDALAAPRVTDARRAELREREVAETRRAIATLSPAQRALLAVASTTEGAVATGRAARSAARLAELGLATIGGGRLSLTPRARAVVVGGAEGTS